MKHLARLITIVLAICMCLGTFAFAATPNANIVSPVANSVIQGTDLAVSVKVLNKKKITVSVYEEKELVGTKFSEGKEEEVLRSINVKDFTPEMVELLANEYAEKKSLILEDGTIKHVIRQVMVGEKSSFTPRNSVTLFAKTIKDQKPGLYMIQVDVLDDDGKVTETYNSFVALQEKPVETVEEVKTEEVPVESKTSLVQFLTNLLKSLIK